MSSSAQLLRGLNVRLRAPEPSDIDAFCRWENDTDAWDSGSTFAPMSRHQLERYIDSYSSDILAERQLRLTIAGIADNEPLGAIDLFDFNALDSRAAVGIIVDAPCRRRGVAREAVDLLAGYARRRLSLNQLWCQVAADNEASLRLFESAGFIRAGILRQWIRRQRGHIDVVLLQRML